MHKFHANANWKRGHVLPTLLATARVQKLRLAMDEESQRAVYRWHDAEHPSAPTWLDRLLDKNQQCYGVEAGMRFAIFFAGFGRGA